MKTNVQPSSFTPRRAIVGGRLAAWLLTGLLALPAGAASLVETPMLADDVAAKKLPPVAERVPKTPLVSKALGKSGGTLRTLIGRAKDVRLLVRSSLDALEEGKLEVALTGLDRASVLFEKQRAKQDQSPPPGAPDPH